MIIDLNDFVKELYKRNNEKDILIQNGIQYFLEYYKQNKRIATYLYYKGKLSMIQEFFGENDIQYFSQINDKLLMKYISILQAKNNKNTTINKYIGTIKTLISFLNKRELINPINIQIQKLNEIKPNINILDSKTIQQISEYMKTKDNQKQVIFFLLAATGIRRTELVNIKRSNVDIENNSIYLEHTKNGHTRFIYFPNYLKELLKNELNKNIKSTYLFTEQNGSKISVYKVDHIFANIRNKLKIKKLSPHMLRHTYATALIESNDIETVRILLGHESYEMTKRYLHIKDKKIMETSLKYNPLATFI